MEGKRTVKVDESKDKTGGTSGPRLLGCYGTQEITQEMTPKHCYKIKFW